MEPYPLLQSIYIEEVFEPEKLTHPYLICQHNMRTSCKSNAIKMRPTTDDWHCCHLHILKNIYLHYIGI